MSETTPAPEDAVIAPGTPTPPPGYRPTKAELLERIDMIYDLQVQGASRKDIRRFVAQKTTWGISPRTIDRYLAMAAATFEKIAAFRRPLELGKAIARLTDLYARSTRIQDYKTALAAQREINDLLGLHAPRALQLDPDDPSAGGFIAMMPTRHGSREEWEQECKAEQLAFTEQRARLPKVIGSTNSAAP